MIDWTHEWGDWLRIVNIALSVLAFGGFLALLGVWAVRPSGERLLAAGLGALVVSAFWGSIELFGLGLAAGFRVPILTVGLTLVDTGLALTVRHEILKRRRPARPRPPQGA